MNFSSQTLPSPNRQRLFRSLHFLLLAALCGGVRLTAHAEDRVVTQASYTATVASDGCLTHLKPTSGKEWLGSGIDISRGVYIYEKGVLKLGAPTQAGRDTFVAKSAQATIRYTFGPTTITCNATNTSSGLQQFFVVLNPGIVGVSDGKSAPVPSGVVGDWKRTVAYQPNTKLTIDGCDKVWGPWLAGAQIVETDLKPGQTRQFTMTLAPLSAGERAALKASIVPKPPRNAALQVDAPLDYEVFQRRTRTEGHIPIAGHFTEPGATVEARLNVSAKSGVAKWQSLPVNARAHTFSADLAAPAGGWYTLDVRTTKAGKLVATTTVAHVGVGEVFVGAGQSNSTNFGQFRTQQTSGMVSSFSGSDWRLANDPQPGTHDKSMGGSFWPSFGDAMYARFHVPIGIATTGHGGTSINQWQPDGELFRWTMTRIRQFGPHGFRALLWHQGENDVTMPAEQYAAKLATVIKASRVQAGWNIPWFVAQVSYHDPTHPSFPTTRAGQKLIWDRGIALQGPDTDTLKGDFRDTNGQGIHFSPKGLKAHGEMWAKVVGDWMAREK